MMSNCAANLHHGDEDTTGLVMKLEDDAMEDSKEAEGAGGAAVDSEVDWLDVCSGLKGLLNGQVASKNMMVIGMASEVSFLESLGALSDSI
ncbi:hypothetical protein OPV22_015775 [Ensete ventricosum]|uniref:Uncharacterized protein n=1 Tax=Ensete ventricosum TaxID=4639 RepID=A0AAV8R6E7_ENSVE|nr:hypothetical protein OPV22_015775 [Ensete ventricosum]